MKKKWIVLFLPLMLMGCIGYGSDPYAMRAAADAALEATQSARDDRAAFATLSAAQTQGAIQAESSLLKAQAEATRQAFANAQTQAAATTQAVQTATAYPLTATPLAATQAALVRKVEQDERRAYWAQFTDPLITILPPLLLFAVLVLLLAGGILAFRRLLPVIEVRGRAFNRGPHDAPVFLLRDGGRVVVVDPDRNFGPALLVGGGQVASGGFGPSHDLQERITSRDQMVDLVRGIPPGQKSELEEWMKKLLELRDLSGKNQPKIEIIEPGAVGSWLAEVEKKLLDEGEDTP